MTDHELDELMAHLDAELLAAINRWYTPERTEQKLQEILRRAGYRTDGANQKFASE